MLDFLCRRDRREIGGHIIELLALLHGLLGFRDEAPHAIARLPLRRRSHKGEAFLQAMSAFWKGVVLGERHLHQEDASNRCAARGMSVYVTATAAVD